MIISWNDLRSASVLGPLADLTHCATTLSELIHTTPVGSYRSPSGKLKSCSVRFKAFNKTGGNWHVTYMVWGQESYSDPRGHTVRIRFMPEANVTDPLDLDVDVSCDCQAFLYYGAQWNTHTRDALEREQQGGVLQAPTQPRHNYVICKHIKAVSERVGGLLEKHLQKHTKDTEYYNKMVEQSKQKVQQRATPRTRTAPTPAPQPVEETPEAGV